MKILLNLKHREYNILQLPILAFLPENHPERSLKFYKCTWKYVNKYLNQQEISNLIKILSYHHPNLLFTAIYSSPTEIVNFLWEQIKNVLTFKEQIEFLTVKDLHMKKGNLLEYASLNDNHVNEMKLWVKNVFLEYGIEV